MKLIYGLFIYILSIIFLFIGIMIFIFPNPDFGLTSFIFCGISSLLFFIASIYTLIFWTFFIDTIYSKNKLIIEDLRNGSFK